MAKNTAEDGKENKEKAKKSSKKSATQKLQEEIDELNIQLSESKDKYLRLFAEFDNFKKRNMKERLDILKTASQDTLAALLPVLDDFDRAKKSADDESSPEQFSEGMTMLYNKIYAVVGQKGLKKMETTGEVFDPELHEAITKIPSPSEDMKGKIIDTIESGYTLNDKIIRHAKVVVGE